MADTGSPWNLPYPVSSDLVKDGAAAIQALAEATADGLDAANIGIGTNVKFVSDATAFSTTSTSFVGTGRTVSITPSSNTSKIFLIATAVLFNSVATAFVVMRVARSGVAATADVIGQSQISVGRTTVVALGLDSPNVSTAVTYEVEVRSASTGTTEAEGAINLMAIEVAA